MRKANSELGIVWRGRLLLDDIPHRADALVTLLGVYYLMDLLYPSCIGQLMRLVQEVAVGEKFKFSTKKLTTFISVVNAASLS